MLRSWDAGSWRVETGDNGVLERQWRDDKILERSLANGQAPKDIAPDCYRWRWAWRKNISVAKALEQRGWMKGLRRINTERALTQFVHLWRQFRTICLQPSQPDTIKWSFTADGNFTAKSAYKVQFRGACAPDVLGSIWKANVEYKCRFSHG
ncbi:hypothetical protein PAHAL_5G158400 [Panicum hallii]|jgi:hypothetical protein|uniref:Reverse transcriptase zinc-binding domain-containing protein n=1 Tax=Panicum hallii TaxID=206008 RepID=A0A2S3HRP6_9POAL|nr:hypothetical protein PAHAL_5G158400 [Panicum hallii]